MFNPGDRVEMVWGGSATVLAVLKGGKIQLAEDDGLRSIVPAAYIRRVEA